MAALPPLRVTSPARRVGNQHSLSVTLLRSSLQLLAGCYGCMSPDHNHDVCIGDGAGRLKKLMNIAFKVEGTSSKGPVPTWLPGVPVTV